MTIAAGRRRWRVQIMQPTETRDDRGGVTAAFTRLRYAWAARRDVGAAERFKAGQELATQSVVWTIPYKSDVTEKMVILDHRGEWWGIEGLAERGQAEDLEIVATRTTQRAVV